MVWAILRCQYWLRGIAHFTVFTDQIALSHLYSGNREMVDFPEELRNLAEATLKYNFSVVYVKGERNTLADSNQRKQHQKLIKINRTSRNLTKIKDAKDKSYAHKIPIKKLTR